MLYSVITVIVCQLSFIFFPIAYIIIYIEITIPPGYRYNVVQFMLRSLPYVTEFPELIVSGIELEESHHFVS